MSSRSGKRKLSNAGDAPIGRLPILTWHAVDDSRSVIATAPELFRWQMSALAALHLRGISLAEAFAHRKREGRFPADAVVLTFDDAYASLADHVLPETRARGFQATVFAASELVGLGATAARAINPDITRDILDWAQLRSLAADGWEIGSHSLTHPDLTRLPRARLEQEIGEARKRIEQQVATPVESFAYPYGQFDGAVRDAAAAHHARACTTRLGFNDGTVDPFQLERIDIHFLRKPRLFLSACRGGLAGYLRFRQYLRNLKTLAS